ncbi:phage tail tape measure protein [Pseudoclavibacter endophyticus]|uniref:Phage tail tape measure protein n=1 Tax=Pseudoclavibacter endophyticus TaxID=1778590 RepID=A0A6H9WKY0_9MICO|nr:phage tail tape measure protein [Pseudoclavibacter endophyticus]KAB1648429.1 phage tail tape measure protein [Pseudoclavibacter endophyticus]GGA72646.1 phage tail tape measure protein [Pseudoclavibacter endophyticus]
MADKSVKVSLIADVQNYLRGMDEASRKTREAERAAQDTSRAMASQTQAMQQVGRGALVLGGLIAVGVGAAVKAYADYDQAMSQVQAATGETAGNMELLSEAAIQAGMDTAYSAVEAADGIENLAKAGVSTADILAGGLTGALDLAAAGSISVASAAETAASTMTQFGLAGSDVAHIADLLSSAANNAQGGVSDLSGALNQSGLVAAQMGASLEETVGTLAAFASAGLIGSDAGTSFRSMLLRLANPTGEAATLMEELGISAYDASGEFVGMANLAGSLEEALGTLTAEQRNAALATIFGQDAIRGANILYNEGRAGIEQWTETVDDSGAAAETAAARLDNLNGDLQILGGSWDTLLIKMGASADGPLRGLVQNATEAVNAFSSMDPAIQGTVLGLGAITAGVLLVGGTMLIAIPQIAAFRTALATLGFTADSARGALGRLSARAGGAFVLAGQAAFAAAPLIGVVVDRLVAASNAAARAQEAFTAAAGASDVLAASHQKWADTQGDNFFGLFAGADQDAESIARLVGGLDDAAAAAAAYYDVQNRGSWDTWNADLNEQISMLNQLGKNLAELAEYDSPAAAQAFQLMAESLHGGDEALVNLLDSMPVYRAQLAEQADGLGIVEGEADTYEESLALAQMALEEANTAGENFADALSEQSAAADDTSGAIESLADALRDYNSVLYDSINAEMDYYAAVDAATAAIEANGQSLDLTTEAGRANMAALLDLGQSSRDYAAQVYETTGSVEDMTAALQNGWQQVYDTAIAMGESHDDAVQYADDLNGIPEEIATEIIANTQPAQDAVDSWIENNNGRWIRVYAYTEWVTPSTPDGEVPRRAAGGAIWGAGPKGVDSVPAVLAPGEHVLTAQEVDLMGGQGAVYAWRAAMRAGVPAFAQGGAVGPQYPVITNQYGRGDVTVTVPIDARGMPSVDAIATRAAHKVADVFRSS